jgi:hypothetical protein
MWKPKEQVWDYPYPGGSLKLMEARYGLRVPVLRPIREVNLAVHCPSRVKLAGEEVGKRRNKSEKILE